MATQRTAQKMDGAWIRLQRKIFTRWVNQKLFTRRGIEVKDVIDDFKDGTKLVALVEVLSEKTYNGPKLIQNPKIKVHNIDNLNNALNFVKEVGVTMKVPPAAESIFGGLEQATLGLTWACILKFLKFGDDDQQLNAKEALLLWLQNQTSSYKPLGVDVHNFVPSLYDGMALCALMHKHRPKMIPDFETKVLKSTPEANIQLAFDVAEKYFGLEKYLTIEEFQNMDEISMVVYSSEYYYGIAEQRKLDLAARRIGKVIDLTKDHDARKVDYTEKSKSLKAHIGEAEKILGDRTIDNTMAGAQKKIEEFYEYKTKDKGEIIGEQLNIESLYNTLAMKLNHHKRPEFVPSAGHSLKDLEGSLSGLESAEQERSEALHAELNRQIYLVKRDEQHKERFAQLEGWVKEKNAYLNKKEEISSVGEAQLHLQLLDGYITENEAVKNGSVSQLKNIGEELEKEKYERTSEAKSREGQIDQHWVDLAKLSAHKKVILDDDLAREQYKEKIRLQSGQHNEKFKKIKEWVAEKEAYLKTRENIDSVSAAQLQLGLLDSYEVENKTVSETSVQQLKDVGQVVLKAEYKSEYSEWKFQNPEEINQRESEVDKNWAELKELSDEKRPILEDHLEREKFKEKLRLQNRQHNEKFSKIKQWIAAKEKYLNVKETVKNSEDARLHLSLLEQYERERDSQHETAVAAFKKLGNHIVTIEYKTKYSQYKWSPPEELSDRENEVDKDWERLGELCAKKKEVLEDDLARELFAENLRRLNDGHKTSYAQLSEWIGEKKKYLETKESIDTSAEAQLQYSLFEAYLEENQTEKETRVNALNKLGKHILDAKFVGKFTQHTFENPEEINQRESDVATRFQELHDLAEKKKPVLLDHVARELHKDKLRLLDQQHASSHKKITEWVEEKEKYLSQRENCLSVSAAQEQIGLLEVNDKEKATMAENNVVKLKKLGKDIVSDVYKSEYSEFAFDGSGIAQREADIDTKFAHLTDLSHKKKEHLDAELKRELEKERLRLEFSSAAREFVRWSDDTSGNAKRSHFGFTLDSVEAYKEHLDKEDANIRKEADNKKEEYTKIQKALEELGGKENPYTDLNLESLAGTRDKLEGALADRNKAYQAELEKQRANDVLCKEFADLVKGFSKWISDNKDAVARSKESLEDQLNNVIGKIKSADEDSSKLKDIESFAEKLKQAGITSNRHTTLSYKDVKVQWEQWIVLLQRKKEMLEEEIKLKALAGVTEEQLREIRENFKAYDVNADGHLDSKELKALLYSLGEELSTAQVNEIMKNNEVEAGKGISLDSFTNYMIKKLGDSDTKEEVVESFKDLNRGKEYGVFKDMELVLKEVHSQYLEKTMKVDGEGRGDYKGWTEDIYSR